MTKKQRAILLSVVTLLLCLALIAGGTYALFSESATLSNHLHAGDLNISLERLGLEAFELDPDTGYMKNTKVTDTAPYTDYSKSNENVFGITDETRIVPFSSYSAEMRINNNGDVAFAYWVEIKFNLSDAAKENLHLDDQIKVSATIGNKTVDNSTGDKMTVGSKDDPLGALAKAGNQKGLPSSQEFTITVLFENLEDEVNNLAQTEELSFDLVVHAVQLPELAPTTSAP